ncbi:MAG: YheU family protein [Deltaproteobacteria bacterium]|nr:YheU family protein [Deltaproteobacteria bacterium]
MTVHRIPFAKLSPDALQGVIDEFISREATDYGAIEADRETKFRQVMNRLEGGTAVLVFDDESETTHIFLADDPILKKVTVAF